MPNDPVGPEAESPSALTPAAEAKRRAARRKFLMRSTAAGSGFLIVTLYHQRSMATQRDPNTMYVSSATTCTSLGRVAGDPIKVDNSLAPSGPKVLMTPCTPRV
jgi:hypothetical protein